jgi:selenocysteine-specific elongation factor
MLVIGTAGHVDHGKSALITALTGIDPDRLREEKERGMTIDLGFAWLTLPSGREVSIVDVPGHERFIKNMLAGVGGIDLALLVVAADEGVMPQTREHLAILDLLQVKSGLVAITKKDLVDDEWLELVVADVEELLGTTCLKGAPIVAVSALSGEGLPRLLETMDRLLASTPPRPDLGRPRLPVDRVFTISGFGTVVTGTLIDGHLALGQEVEILPRRLRARIRGLQTHKHKIERASPGSRVAINLTGVAKDDLERGHVVASPGWLRPTLAVDVRLRLIRDLPRPLAHNTAVSFHSGSSEAMGRVRLLDKEELRPGETGWAQIKLAQPLALVKGDPFIIRSPNETLGGGEVLVPQAKRHRRFHLATLQSLELAERGTPGEVLLQSLNEQTLCTVRELQQRSGLPMAEAQAALQALHQEGQVQALAPGQALEGDTYVLSTQGWAALREKVRSLLDKYHHQFPLRLGMPKEELRSRLRLSPHPYGELLQRLAGEGELVEGKGWVRLPDHQVRLSPAQEAQVSTFLAALEANPFSPSFDQHPAEEILELLTEEGRVVKVAEGVYFSASAYREMVERIIEKIRAQGQITVAEVRDMFGSSRKYALALMEHLDQQRVTQRVGDQRVLRE